MKTNNSLKPLSILINFVIVFSFPILINTNKMYAQELKFGNQIWATNNLDLKKFRNGDAITQAQSDEDWVKAMQNKQPAWCYSEDIDDKLTQQVLYNYYAIIDPRGLAPESWKIPSNSDWLSLIDFFGGTQKAFSSFRMENSLFHSEVFSGYRTIQNDTQTANGKTTILNSRAVIFPETRWWAKDELNNELTKYMMLAIDDVGEIYSGEGDKGMGCSVRCIKE